MSWDVSKDRKRFEATGEVVVQPDGVIRVDNHDADGNLVTSINAGDLAARKLESDKNGDGDRKLGAGRILIDLSAT